MRKHNILYKYQDRFREYHSTSHAIMDMMMEYIYKSLNENKFVFGVYIDLKKKHYIQLIMIFFYQNYNTMGCGEMP